jgi:hypothetical protein
MRLAVDLFLGILHKAILQVFDRTAAQFKHAALQSTGANLTWRVCSRRRFFVIARLNCGSRESR